MKVHLPVSLCVLAIVLSGCGAQSMILDSQGAYLLTVTDVLARPTQTVSLRAKLQGGDLLRPQAGYVIRFFQDGGPIIAAQTNSDGLAEAHFTPQSQGDYFFTADPASVGFDGPVPKPRKIMVACRPTDARMAIVDLDKTVVASGFHTVLIGKAEPMAGSAEVLERLSATHTIVYLTHRPEYFGPRSKAWLSEHGYPRGPVLLSSTEGFLSGSGQYKREALAGLRKSFSRIEIGIGDKISDAAAYHRNGLKSFLVYQIPSDADAAELSAQIEALSELPEAVQVVENWQQVAKALFADRNYPRSAMQAKLLQLHGERTAVEAEK